jgi:hypothetical protein
MQGSSVTNNSQPTSHHLRMSRRVVARNRRIETATDDLSILDHQRPHRHLAGILRQFCQFQREAHVICIHHNDQPCFKAGFGKEGRNRSTTAIVLRGCDDACL